MKFNRNTAGIVLLVAIALTGAIVLVALGKIVPEFVSLIAITGLGALAGVTVPDTGGLAPKIDLAGLASALSHELTPPTPPPAPAAPAPAVSSMPATVTMVTTPGLPPAMPVTDQAPAAAPAPPPAG